MLQSVSFPSRLVRHRRPKGSAPDGPHPYDRATSLLYTRVRPGAVSQKKLAAGSLSPYIDGHSHHLAGLASHHCDKASPVQQLAVNRPRRLLSVRAVGTCFCS